MPEIIDIEKINKSFNYVLLFGNYDGMHIGHIHCIKELVDEAKKNNFKSILMFFQPHTLEVIKPMYTNYLLTDYKSKVDLLSKTDIDFIIPFNFNSKISNFSSSDFIDFILSKINPKSILIGYDNKFGKDRKGDFKFLENKLNNHDIIIRKLPRYLSNDNILVKSSVIRNYLLDGNVISASKHLGRNFKISGIVIKGNSIGRKLGFPTANIKLSSDKLIVPKNGVYHTIVTFQDRKYNSLSNIGFSPTFSSVKSEKRIESYLITNDDLNIYDKTINVEFISRIRDEIKFNNEIDLIKQIKKDLQFVNNRS